jgi:predicted ATPase
MVTYNDFVGLYLKKRMEEENKDKYLFDVVSHLNKFPKLIKNPAERLEMAQLNLAV